MGPASPHQSWSARQATRRGKPFDPITSGSKPAEQSIDSRATHNVHRSPRWGGWSHCRQADKPTSSRSRGRLRRAGRPRRHRGDAYDQHEHSGTVSWRHRVEEASTPEVREVPPRSPFVCRLASLAASHARARRAASPEVAASFASHAAHLTCDHPHQRLRLWVREARGSLIRSCR